MSKAASFQAAGKAVLWFTVDGFYWFPRRILGRTKVPVREIISLKATPMTVGFISVKHRQGSLRIMSRMTGLYELIGRVKALFRGREGQVPSAPLLAAGADGLAVVSAIGGASDPERAARGFASLFG